jgi:hypothetical protein
MTEKVTIHRFLETHKHHIMHCYRIKTSCCSTQANCNYPRAQPLSKRQWKFLYTEEQSKDSCRDVQRYTTTNLCFTNT